VPREGSPQQGAEAVPEVHRCGDPDLIARHRRARATAVEDLAGHESQGARHGDEDAHPRHPEARDEALVDEAHVAASPSRARRPGSSGTVRLSGRRRRSAAGAGWPTVSVASRRWGVSRARGRSPGPRPPDRARGCPSRGRGRTRGGATRSRVAPHRRHRGHGQRHAMPPEMEQWISSPTDRSWQIALATGG
jgi:hypothetical protein